MTEADQTKILLAQFGGDVNDSKIMSQLDQFINGLGTFAGLFSSSEPNETGQIALSIPEKLHRHRGLNIFVGANSITKELLLQNDLTNSTPISGRTLLRGHFRRC